MGVFSEKNLLPTTQARQKQNTGKSQGVIDTADTKTDTKGVKKG